VEGRSVAPNLLRRHGHAGGPTLLLVVYPSAAESGTDKRDARDVTRLRFEAQIYERLGRQTGLENLPQMRHLEELACGQRGHRPLGHIATRDLSLSGSAVARRLNIDRSVITSFFDPLDDSVAPTANHHFRRRHFSYFFVISGG